MENQPESVTTWGEFKEYFSEEHDDEKPIRARVYPVTGKPDEEMEVFTFSRTRRVSRRKVNLAGTT